LKVLLHDTFTVLIVGTVEVYRAFTDNLIGLERLTPVGFVLKFVNCNLFHTKDIQNTLTVLHQIFIS
jgi:hypothetical protein